MIKVVSTKNLFDKNHISKSIDMFWSNQNFIKIFLIIIILIIGLIFYKNTIHNSKYLNFIYKINTAMISKGFFIKNINITGHNIIKEEDILNTFKPFKYTNILDIDLLEIHKNLLLNKWIENLEIRRVLPDTIKIKIIEKKAIAIWQTKLGNNLITQNGDIIFDAKINKFKNKLPILLGEEANKNASYILNILKQNPELYKKIWSISFINKRRWNIHFKEGLTILLPKKNIVRAWKQIQIFQNKSKILELGLTEIDIRNENQILGKIDVAKKFYLKRKKLL